MLPQNLITPLNMMDAVEYFYFGNKPTRSDSAVLIDAILDRVPHPRDTWYVPPIVPDANLHRWFIRMMMVPDLIPHMSSLRCYDVPLIDSVTAWLKQQSNAGNMSAIEHMANPHGVLHTNHMCHAILHPDIAESAGRHLIAQFWEPGKGLSHVDSETRADMFYQTLIQINNWLPELTGHIILQR